MKPKYLKLRDTIKDFIKSGVYKKGDKIPTEKEFMKKYNLSRDTVRKSIQSLVQDNILYKIQGRGTYVAEEVYNQTLLKFYSFTDEMIKKGKKPTSKILSFEIVSVENERLEEVFVGTKNIYKLVRLRLANDEPIMYETTYLNKNKLEGLTLEMLKEKPLYEIIRTKYRIDFEKAIEKFKAVIPNSKISKKLDMKPGKPCMQLKRYVYANESLLEYTKTLARGDKLTFEIKLK